MSAFERHKYLTLFGVGVVLALSVDFIFATIYLFATGSSWTQSQLRYRIEVERTFRVESALYHHDLARSVNAVNNAFWGERRYTVKTNSLGFKDSEPHNIPQYSAKHRVLFIGDSFTEAVGLNYDESFVGLLGNRFVSDVDVLNAGVSTYSPVIYWRKIKYLVEDVGLKIDEVVVYLDLSDIPDEAQLYCLNDEERVEVCLRPLPSASGADAAPRWKAFMRDHFILTPVAYYWLKRSLLRAEPAIDKTASRWTIDPKLFETMGRPGLARSQKYLEKLSDMLRRRGIGMTLAVYPHPAQIYENDRNSIQLTYWAEWARQNRVHFVEHFTSIFQRRDAIGADSAIDDYYIPGDIHFNEKGNRLLAEDLIRARFNSEYFRGVATRRDRDQP